MKKVLALALALTVLLSFSSCTLRAMYAEKAKEQENRKALQNQEYTVNDANRAIAEISPNNWSEVVEECYGVNLVVPEGWQVKEVANYNGYNNVRLLLVPGGTDDYVTFGDTIFEATKAASTKQPVAETAFPDTAVVEGYNEWEYYPDIKNGAGKPVGTVEISCYDDPDDNTDDIEIIFRR